MKHFSRLSMCGGLLVASTLIFLSVDAVAACYDVPMRAPLDDYTGPSAHPFNDPSGHTHFLTRVEGEKNGTPNLRMAVTFDDKLLPASCHLERVWFEDHGWQEDMNCIYVWDSKNRLVSDGVESYVYDADDRVVERRHKSSDYEFLQTFEYDDSGHCVKSIYSTVYPDRVEYFQLTESEWTVSEDGVETNTILMSNFDSANDCWFPFRKEIKKTFHTHEGGWIETSAFLFENDGWVADSREFEKYVYFVANTEINSRLEYKKEERIADELRVVEEEKYELTLLDDSKFQLSGPSTSYQYYTDGTLNLKTERKSEKVWAVHKSAYDDIMIQDNISQKHYMKSYSSGEWRLERDMRWEYNDRWQWTLYEEVEDYGFEKFTTRSECFYDEIGRSMEIIQTDGKNDELAPHVRTRATYVGNSNSYNTLEYAYYNKDAQDWNSPYDAYEFEWDTSIEGNKVYYHGFIPSVRSSKDYLPVSCTRTRITGDGPLVETERYYYNTAEELASIKEVAEEEMSVSGPVTVFSLSGIRIGAFDNLDQAALPKGLYLLKQGDKVSKYLQR